MKSSTKKNNEISTSLSSKRFFNKRGKGNFFTQSKETETPFFSASNIQQKEGNREVNLQSPNKENPNTTGMSDSVKSKMEESFGVNFSDVVIHDNSSSAQNLGALAYTQGTDIHFAPGQFNQYTSEGQELLGHELSHVVQQKQARVHTTGQDQGFNINESSSLEAEANTQASIVASGGKVSVGSVPQTSNASRVQKKSSPIQMRKPLPGPDEMDGAPQVDPSLVFEAVMAAARNAKGGHAEHARSALEARLMVPISRAARGDLATVPINVYNTEKFNHHWTGNIIFYRGDSERSLSSLNESVGTGGSAGTASDMGTTSTRAQTDSASATASSESSVGIEEGGASASQGQSRSGTVSTSETNTRVEQTGITGSGSRTSSASSQRVVHRFSSEVIVYVSITGTYDAGWNPLTWGGGIGDLLDGSDHGTAERTVGTLRFKRYGGSASGT